MTGLPLRGARNTSPVFGAPAAAWRDQQVECERMQMQPVRIAVLGQMCRLARFGRL